MEVLMSLSWLYEIRRQATTYRRTMNGFDIAINQTEGAKLVAIRAFFLSPYPPPFIRVAAPPSPSVFKQF